MRFNKHHTLWPRKNYSIDYEPFVLRTRPQMIHTMPIEDHNDLHRDIDPIKPMSISLARIALQFLDEQPFDAGRLEQFRRLVERFDNVSRYSGRVATEAGLYAEHFGLQLGYIGEIDGE